MSTRPDARGLTWRRLVNRHVVSVTTLIGLCLIFGGVIYVDDSTTLIFVIAFGLLLLEGGVWYMANPVLTSERQYPELRDTVDQFTALVRELHGVSVGGNAAEIQRVRTAMMAAVDDIVRVAGDARVRETVESGPAADTADAPA